MATTTNYGWTTPDDTALVKDGAAAIRTLGSSVDTTTKALNPETTLGDIAYRSSTANVKTRLALGTAGQVLKVNSGATAPEWGTADAGGMTLLSTTTLSGASTTISSISQSYNHLQILIVGATTSSSNGLLMRLNGQTGAIYNQTKYRTTTTTITNQSAATEFALDFVTDTTNNNQYSLTTIFNYTEAVYKGIQHHGARDTVIFYEGFSMNSYSSAINSVTILTDPLLTMGGTVKIYGVK
jgi:hypothetical protein